MLWGNAIFSKIVFGALILCILILFQSFLSDSITIMGVKFDLSIVILVYVALSGGPTQGVIFGFLIGLLLDIFTPPTLGWGALVKCLIGFTVGSFKDNLYLEGFYARGGIIFFALMLNDLLYYVFTSGINTSTFRTLTHYSLLSAIYTSIGGMLIFPVLSRIHWERLGMDRGVV